MGTGTYRVLFVLGLAAFAAACGTPDVNGSNYRNSAPDRNRDNDDDDKAGGAGDAGGVVVAPPITPDTGDVDTNPADDKPPVTPTPTPLADVDKDGIADDVDCAPNDAAIAGTRLLNDPLTEDKGFFARADGFPASWSYNGGYVQSRLAASPDQAIFTKDAAISEAIVEVIAASTEITSTITPILRQMFITFGTKMNNGVLSAVGCGLEVDASQTPTQKTTVARLNGAPGSVTATPLNRVDRGAVQAKEEFKMKATLKGTTLTCQVVIGGATTTTATANVGTTTGSIGLYTNQTKALFKSASICKLR